MDGLLIVVNLLGNIEGCIKHTNRQKNTVKTKSNESVSKVILHSDRNATKCFKTIKISEKVLQYWKSEDFPSWENQRSWKKKKKDQRIESYVDQFDEGFGVTYEYIR